MVNDFFLTQTGIMGFTSYGVTLLFLKALLILITAQTLAEQFEFNSACVRHNIWLLTLASLAALPVLTELLPSWHLIKINLPIVTSPLAGGSDKIIENTNFISPGLSSFDWLIIAYLAVVGFRLLRLSMEIIKAGVVTARAENADKTWYDLAAQLEHHSLKIKHSTDVNGPVTWGVISPVILLPKQSQHWSSLEKEMILRHEIGHICRADWLSQLLGQCVAILYWPVPGVSRALKQLSLEAERACDNFVLSYGLPAPDYAALLVHQAKNTTLPTTVSLGNSSELSQRVKHIVSAYIDRAGEKKTQLAISLATGLLLIPFSSIGAIGIKQYESPFANMTIIPLVPFSKTNGNQDNYPTDTIVAPQKPLQISAPPDSAVTVDENIYASALSVSVNQQNINEYLSNEISIHNPSTVAPQLLSWREPEYPLSARRKGIEGKVIVEFGIDENGRVINPIIIDSKPSLLFNKTVIKSMQNYRFVPFIVNGHRMRLMGLRKEFSFKLQDKPLPKRASTGDSRAGNRVSFDSG